MDMNRAEGGLKETVGRLQDAAGALAGDARAQLDGKGRQFAGQARAPMARRWTACATPSTAIR